MITTLFIYYKVECKFDYEEKDSYSTFTFMSLDGANKWIEKNKSHLDWASIMSLEAHPVNENDIDGQIYYGVIYNEFYEKSGWEK